MKKDKSKFRSARRITPADTMREFVGGGGFGMAMAVALLFALLHYRVITTELEYGTGGLWCSLGIPAAFCLAISGVLTFFSAKTKLLPALVPIIGLCGIEASIIMFFVVQIRRMAITSGVLGIIQEISMLVFFAAVFVSILFLIFTGIGMKVPSAAGIPATLASVLALALFVIRAMYSFSALITAISRNFLLNDETMAEEIEWILRSVQPGTEGAASVYYARVLDSVGLALLLLTCVTLMASFGGFFAEQAFVLKNAQDIPLPTQQRRGAYVGYEEYTDDSPKEGQETSFELTHDGYYVEKKITPRPKFKRRERTESEEAADAAVTAQESLEPEDSDAIAEEVYIEEYYDNYVPGEGWREFYSRSAPEENETRVERKKVTLRPAEPPAPDPNDPDIWNKYKK